MQTLLTLRGKVSYEVEDTLEKLAAAIVALEQENAKLKAILAAQPKILTLAEISHGLSSTGAAPLNVTGLTGKLAP